MASPGRVSLGAYAPNSDTVRSAQSAANTASTRRSSSLSVNPPGWRSIQRFSRRLTRLSITSPVPCERSPTALNKRWPSFATESAEEQKAGPEPSDGSRPAPRHERGSRHGAPRGRSSQSCRGRRTRLLAPPGGQSRCPVCGNKRRVGQEPHFSFHETAALARPVSPGLRAAALGLKATANRLALERAQRQPG